MKKTDHRQQNAPYQDFYEKFISRIRVRFTLLWVSLLLGCLPFTLFAQTTEANKEKSKPVVLHNLSNEDLLKQAKGIFNLASNRYLAQKRGLAKSELLLNRAKLANLGITLSEREDMSSEEIPPLEKAKKEVEQAKVCLDDFTHELELVEEEKTRLDQYIEQIEPTQSAAKNFLSALNELSLPLFEIGLRVNDGTLKADMVPRFFNEETLNTQREILLTEQELLKKETEIAARKLKTIVRSVKVTKEAVIEFKSLYTAAEKKYSQELNRQSVEQDYLKKSPERLLFEMSKLQEELILFNGAFNLSFGRFNTSQARTALLQVEIDKLKAPETKELFQKTGIQAKEAEQIAKKGEEVVAYHTKRIKQLGNIRSERQSMIRQSELFQGDATVLSGHYFRMQVIAKIIENLVQKGKIKPEKIPEYNRLEALIASDKDASAQAANVLSATQKTKEGLNYIDGEIKKSEGLRADIEERLRQMKKTSEAARQAKQWNAELKDLTAKQIVQRFEENSNKIEANRVELDKAKETYQKGRHTADLARKKFDSFKDPLLLSAKEESHKKRKDITQKLYELAGLELSSEKKRKSMSPLSHRRLPRVRPRI